MPFPADEGCMNKDIIKLYQFLIDRKLYISACQVSNLLKSAATDPVATNKTDKSSIQGGYFEKEDVDVERYNQKIWGLYFDDIYKVHYEKDKKKLLAENRKLPPEQQASEDEISELALESVKRRTTKTANKAIESHSTFVEELMRLKPSPEGLVVSPASGFAHEQIVAPDLNWKGLEYQQNLVDMANQRNQQMSLPTRSDQWSLLNLERPDDPIGEDWADRINTIKTDDGEIEAIYAKHACGGLTDGAMFDAIKKDVPKIFLATCCAHRYTQLSWRILEPTDEAGNPLSFEEYNRVAKTSKRQDERGEAACELIDDWRQKYLEDNGYIVDRGTTNFGPFIRAKRPEGNS